MGDNASMLKPTDYQNYQTGAKINLYYPPILVIIGTIGNILSLIVYTRKKYRSKAMGVHIPTLSILDTIMLLVGLLQYWLLFNFYPTILTKAHCRGMFFVVNMVGNTSHWVIVLFTMERFVAILRPMKFSFWWTPTKAWIAITLTFIVSVVKNFHYLWTTDFLQKKESGVAICAFALTTKDPWVTKYQKFEMIISSILPFVIISVSNIGILITLKLRQEQKDTSQGQSNKEKRKSSTGKENKTILLVAVSSTFVILTSPLFIFRLYYSDVDISKDASLAADYNLGHHICHKLWYTNSGINFFLYGLFGKYFRKDLKALFISNRKVQRLRKILAPNKLLDVVETHIE